MKRSAQRFRIAVFGAGIALLMSAPTASAALWSETGDAQLRSDIELLAAAGVIDNVTTQWPIPWGGVLYRLDQKGALEDQPEYVLEAAQRVHDRGVEETEFHKLHLSVSADATNSPATVRGFDAMARQTLMTQVNLDYVWESTAVHLALGAKSATSKDHQIFVPDGSYIAQRVGNAAVYAGYISHWWGPGWSTALSLSNNARPFPQIGINRIDTTPFESSWLRWIGPWQAEFFVGVLDGERVARNTLFNGLRVSASPIDGLELALSRTEQLCGTGHPCKPITEFFNVMNDPQHVSKSKDETNFDVRYTGVAWGTPFAVYTQFMDRDTGPFTHSCTSHLFGASVWVPVSSTAVRLTAEYADTISTQNFFSFGKDFYGITYWDYKYTDGWQYRNRILGSSLGTDSRLAMVQAGWAGPYSVSYTLTYYHAAIGSPQSTGVDPTKTVNMLVSTSPVTLNVGDVRVRFPFDSFSFDLGLRMQDTVKL
jgi:hypothetical protein